jgi:enterobactin synthetase component D / holo-[acyl-carrier protein] synthase
MFEPEDAAGPVPELIAGLLPGSVEIVETRDDLPDGELFPGELPAVARAVPERRREFTTGRACARRALRRLGFPAEAIPVGHRGDPLWPRGVVGSITHCRGYRACAVARSEAILALGIDAEPNIALPVGVWEEVAFGREVDLVSRLARTGAGAMVHLDRLVFSAKEAVYKAWFPLAQTWLGFEDVELDVDADGSFRAALRIPGPVVCGVRLAALGGRWGVRDGLVGTAVTLPAHAR